MSNIRFRAWHKELKYMFPVATLYWWADNSFAKVESNDNANLIFEANEVVIMQSTQMLDAHCGEIFEGDILLLQSEQPLFFQEVHFNNGAFMVGRKDVEATWWYLACCMQKHRVQVIGNIYENSELLNDRHDNEKVEKNES